ncbi:hypothetical protein F1654_06990 [Alkalicaulis satelles]|uniref:Uncharacterized protein n=1 Tax=Alkalicaulis satelles TaxID=2609175 RepID=A0A5M6ZHE0_9PROT|nr:hypothetical protein [Alkalicaulis satelles]KAA5803545.1 hypothetical protein F1654_06990 [Alkalicaulis satelles]
MMHFVLDTPAVEAGLGGLEAVAPDARRLALAPDGWRSAHAELDSVPSARAVLFVRSAATSVAGRLKEGECAPSAMSAWRALAQLELLFFRANRRRVLLLDADDAAADPEHTRKVVSAWYDEGVAPQPALNSQCEDKAASASLEIAVLLCASDPDMRALMSEQAASCAWINQAPPPMPLEAACQAAERLSEIWAEQEMALEVWRDALEAAQTNLRQALSVQAELQASTVRAVKNEHAATLSEMEGRWLSARSEAQDLRTMLHACEAQLARLETDRLLLADSATRSQAELASLKIAFEEAEQDRLQLRAEREKIFASRTWRLTAPARWAVNTLTGRK